MVYRDDAYYLAELEDKLIQTVSAYVKSIPRPFSVLLSGGFDSGLLAALTKPDFVFNVRFDGETAGDESWYADAIIDHLKLKSKTIVYTITKEELIKNAPDAIKAMGEPVTHFSVVPFYMTMRFIADFMQKRGLDTNVLSGEGPDEYLGGYARQIIFDELNKLYRIPELRGYHSMIDKILGFFYADRNVAWANKYGEFMGYEGVKALKFGHFDYPLQGILGKMDMELGVIEKMEQKMAKTAGVSLHYPYINNSLAGYCYQLPDSLKIRDGVTKWGFRQICKKYLPEIMWDRSKVGGPVAPINSWLFNKSGYDKAEWLAYQEEILREKT